MAMYLRNAWYAAAFADEVGDTPFARTLLDEPMVIYRRSDGRPAMLVDRCPHRFAPLSMGRIVGDDLQCPYHGLRFNAEGACVRNPHMKGAGPLQAAQVGCFPVMERYGVIWFWAGDPARADPSALPRIEFLEQPERFSTVKDRLHVEGNYQLIVDNLLDLSHAAFIHPQFSGAERPPEQLLAATRQKLERRERSIVNHRMRVGLPAPAATRKLFGYDDNTPVNNRTTMVWHPPALLDFPAGVWAMDEDEQDGAHIPQLHLITPETELSSHYFFINGRNRRRDDPEVDAALLQMFDLAFRQQDEPIIEAVQRRMGKVTDIDQLRPVLLQTDAAPVSARRLLAALIAEEQAEARDQPPDERGTAEKLATG
jgi:vanillate O-demethylase monooxygenase subunit